MKVQDWIEDWVGLWPAGVHNKSGYAIRNQVKDVVIKMLNFVKDNPNYTKGVIFEATKLYLIDQERAGWQYTKMAAYFIAKRGEPSVLAQYCARWEAGHTKSTVPVQPEEWDYSQDFIN